jgi:hypothetical protein
VVTQPTATNVWAASEPGFGAYARWLTAADEEPAYADN